MNPESLANQVLDRCDSTNRLARILGDAGYPHGTWVSARIQESGRGRLGRAWESIQGNLFLSILYQSKEQSRWSWVPLVTAIGVTDALKSYLPQLNFNIKWPNDLWVQQDRIEGSWGKLGGILCEAVGSRDRSYIVVGLGLNCWSAPDGLDQQAASLSPQVSADEIRPQIIRGVLDAYEELKRPSGLQDLLERYQARAVLSGGTLIEWTQVRGGLSCLNSGEVLGLGSSGELLVKSLEGETLAIYAEDVRIRPAKKMI